MLNLITDSRLKLNEEEGTVNMCLAIQQMRESSMAAGKTEGIAEGMVKGIEKGIEKGMVKGMAEGRLKAYAEMVADGAIDIHFAAQKFNMTTDEFMKKTGVKVPVN